MPHIHDRQSYEELRDAVLWWGAVFTSIGRFFKRTFRRVTGKDLEGDETHKHDRS
jgi:hypothetical protein